jgi:hypothetical protein
MRRHRPTRWPRPTIPHWVGELRRGGVIWPFDIADALQVDHSVVCKAARGRKRLPASHVHLLLTVVRRRADRPYTDGRDFIRDVHKEIKRRQLLCLLVDGL